MGPVDSNRITGAVLGVNVAIGCGIFTCPPNTMTYTIDVDNENEVARVDYGRMTIGGVNYPVLGLAKQC